MKRFSPPLLPSIFAFVLLPVSIEAANMERVFIVFQADVDLVRSIRQIEKEGGLIRQRFPPRIVTGEIPRTLKMDAISPVQSLYKTPISLKELEPFGPLAVAAGTEWNRQFVRPEAGASMKSMAAMRSLVSQRSLPAPQGLRAALNGEALSCSWETVPSGLYYHLQIARDGSFAKPLSEVRTHNLSSLVPRPESSEPAGTIYVRVRAVDRLDTLDAPSDLVGAWSEPVSLTADNTRSDLSLAPPQPTSPLDGYETQGFTAILEWTGGGNQARIQVSRTPSFKDLFSDEVVSDGEYVIASSALHVGDTLYWRVRQWGTSKSGWSTIRSIKIGEPRHEHTDAMINPEAQK